MGRSRIRRAISYAALALSSISLLACTPSVEQQSAPTTARELPADTGAVGPELPSPVITPRQAVEVTAAASNAKSGDALLMAVITFLSAAVLLCGGLIVWLFRWRRQLPDGQVSILPEEIIKLAQALARANMAAVEASATGLARVKSEYAEIQRGFSVFSNAAALKDAEIERLRKGGDRQAYLQFVRRFVRVLRLADSDISEDRGLGRDTSALESLRNHLHDALQDCGIEPFSPSAGEDYRDRIDIAEGPRAVGTSDAQQDWKIAKVVHSGFQMRTADTPIVIEPAVVEIFRHSA